MAFSVAYSPTQQRLMNVLGDELSHSKAELLKCLDDELAGRSNFTVHMTYLRKKLRTVGRDVVYLAGNYRVIRTMASANDGRT